MENSSMIIKLLQDLQDKFKCRACGRCCLYGHGPTLTEDDIAVIADFLGCPSNDEQRIPVIEKAGTKGKYELTLERPCFFMDRQNMKCTIHEAKPDACKKYPFIMYLEGNASLDAILICPVARDMINYVLKDLVLSKKEREDNEQR